MIWQMKVRGYIHVSINTDILFLVKAKHFSDTNPTLLRIIKLIIKHSAGEKLHINSMILDYQSYKRSFFNNMKYDPMSYAMICYLCLIELGYSKLDVVEIYCGAATYDKIEKDVKVTPETALGLIFFLFRMTLVFI